MIFNEPFNPLDKLSLAESIVKRLLGQPATALPPSGFAGAGIYALYYAGDFEAYQPITQANSDGKFQLPIYVGKATPTGGRKGIDLLKSKISVGNSLYSRLNQHAVSIVAANNLDVTHFRCRYLVIEDIWIPLGESMLLDMYRPLWNVVVEGFGNHDPGKGRSAGRKPKWDVLHPGRKWAEHLVTDVTIERILKDIRTHFRQ